MPRKNVEYIPVTSRPRIRFALTRPRELKIRIGMIGFATRFSTTRNVVISAAAIAPKPRTGADIQPCAVAWTTA